MVLLRRKYLHTNIEFRLSESCTVSLQKCLDDIIRNPSRVYIMLNDLKLLFKLNTSKIGNKVSNN